MNVSFLNLSFLLIIMSLIIDDFPIISLTENGKKYGIKPVSGEYRYLGLLLPIGLKDEKESRQLVSEIRDLFNEVKVYPWYDHISVEVKSKRGFLFKRTYHIFLKRGENSIQIATWSPRKNENKVIIDTILRETVLGKRLKEYWLSKDGISEDEAERRLEEITPYYNMKNKI